MKELKWVFLIFAMVGGLAHFMPAQLSGITGMALLGFTGAQLIGLITVLVGVYLLYKKQL